MEGGAAVTDIELAKIMFEDGKIDGNAHVPMKYQDEPAYAIGYAEGESR